jgi:hypothetical protein
MVHDKFEGLLRGIWIRGSCSGEGALNQLQGGMQELVISVHGRRQEAIVILNDIQV